MPQTPPDWQQWQLDVTAKLAMLIQQTGDLTTQVTRQNGNVTKLWAEMDAVKRDVTAANAQDLWTELGTIKKDIHDAELVEAKRAGTAKAAAWGWSELLKPLLYFLVGAVLSQMAANFMVQFHSPVNSSSTTVTTESKSSGK